MRSRVPLWRQENLTEGQPSVQHSANQAFIVEWSDGSDSLLKGTRQPTGSLPKSTWTTLRPWEAKSSGLIQRIFNYLATIPNGMCVIKQALSVTSLIPPPLQSLGCFSVTGTGRLVRMLGKMDTERYRAILSGNLFPESQTRVKVYTPTRQQPEEYHQENTGVALGKL